jgi:hypothetical protein
MPRSTPAHVKVVLSLVVIALTAAGLSAAAFTVAQTAGIGRGVTIVVVVWIIMQLLRLGFEYDDGIDFKQLLLPSPLDWGVKVDRIINFWTSPRLWFRAMYLGTTLALIIVVVRFGASKH